MKLPNKQCRDCPFRSDGVELRPEKMANIFSYLIEGVNHLCHKDRTNNTVCLGGRNWQLKMWCSRGWIAEPTNEALATEMRGLGVEPEKHIAGKN